MDGPRELVRWTHSGGTRHKILADLGFKPGHYAKCPNSGRGLPEEVDARLLAQLPDELPLLA